jgi:serine/threonine protein kinase
VLHLCPACQRSFEEPGFCPFDRTPLVTHAAPDSQTLLSSAMPAAQPLTDLDPKRTFPMGSRSSELPASQPATSPDKSPSMRSLSASDSPAAALAMFKTKQDSVYDRLVGETLDGRYFVEKKIGEGGMGVVFAARHAVIERPLAIKVLKREVMRDTATIQRFVQEAKAASRIGHPNIVDVTDFGTTPDGMTYSVMEYVNGQTLGTAIREAAPFPLERAFRIAAQIARALGAAHDKGIVHRDLKPENVFLVDRDRRDGRGVDFVKIVDFGIAKVTPLGGANPNEPRLTRAGSVFGTPEYMAPEQAAGRSDTDGRVDIYALGVILYEMITGRVPHKGDSTVRTLAMQMLDPVKPPTEARPDLVITPEAEALVLKALAKKREHRFQTMGEVLAAIEAMQTQVGTSVTGSPVLALTPLPPGADPTLFAPAAGPQVPTPLPMVPITERGEAPRAKAPTSPQRRLLDEPEFVTHDRPATFEHVFTEETRLQHRRRWPLLLFGAMIMGGAAGSIALVAKSRSQVIAEASRDAGKVIEPSPDAALIVEVAVDAVPEIVIVEPDAGHRIVRLPGRDAGVVPGIPSTPNGRGTINVQVITKPDGAALYVGHSYRGTGAVNLEEQLGGKLDVQCRLRGYKPGNVSVVFDGKTEYVMCVLERIKICIDGIKNPFDDCELDPDAPAKP